MLTFILKHKYYIAVVLNISMICVAWINWHGVSKIFETPENIKSYTWLKAVNQEPAPQTFKQSTLPKGEVLRAEQLYSISKDLLNKPEQINAINTYLKHHYLTNYKTLNSANYLVGNYQVVETRELTKDDWITQGLSINLQAIELIHDELTSNWVTYPLEVTLLLPQTRTHELPLEEGTKLELRSSQAISIIHFYLPKQNSASTRSLIDNFTPRVIVVPIGQHLNLTGQSKLISIHPPKELNMQALRSE
mgnify:CR=1 FL=1